MPCMRNGQTMHLITATKLWARYGRTTVLHDVSLQIRKGEIITIVGPNGSGKSTLLHTLIGAVPLTSGTIQRHAELRVGYVPQKLKIDPTLPITVARFLGLPQPVSRPIWQAALERTGVAGLAMRQMQGLSGGQLQRVLLARALLHSPDVLMLDEPTQGLDQPGAAAFYHHIEQLRNETGCAVLMVSHELHVVMAASDHVICLNGHICCQGHPNVVASAPEYRKLFGNGTGGALALYRHDHDHTHQDDNKNKDIIHHDHPAG